MSICKVRLLNFLSYKHIFQLEDISPGINLVYGTNGSGKSNFIRSILYFFEEKNYKRFNYSKKHFSLVELTFDNRCRFFPFKSKYLRFKKITSGDYQKFWIQDYVFDKHEFFLFLHSNDLIQGLFFTHFEKKEIETIKNYTAHEIYVFFKKKFNLSNYNFLNMKIKKSLLKLINIKKKLLYQIRDGIKFAKKSIIFKTIISKNKKYKCRYNNIRNILLKFFNIITNIFCQNFCLKFDIFFLHFCLLKNSVYLSFMSRIFYKLQNSVNYFSSKLKMKKHLYKNYFKYSNILFSKILYFTSVQNSLHKEKSWINSNIIFINSIIDIIKIRFHKINIRKIYKLNIFFPFNILVYFTVSFKHFLSKLNSIFYLHEFSQLKCLNKIIITNNNIYDEKLKTITNLMFLEKNLKSSLSMSLVNAIYSLNNIFEKNELSKKHIYGFLFDLIIIYPPYVKFYENIMIKYGNFLIIDNIQTAKKLFKLTITQKNSDINFVILEQNKYEYKKENLMKLSKLIRVNELIYCKKKFKTIINSIFNTDFLTHNLAKSLYVAKKYKINIFTEIGFEIRNENKIKYINQKKHFVNFISYLKIERTGLKEILSMKLTMDYKIIFLKKLEQIFIKIKQTYNKIKFHSSLDSYSKFARENLSITYSIHLCYFILNNQKFNRNFKCYINQFNSTITHKNYKYEMIFTEQIFISYFSFIIELFIAINYKLVTKKFKMNVKYLKKNNKNKTYKLINFDILFQNKNTSLIFYQNKIYIFNFMSRIFQLFNLYLIRDSQIHVIKNFFINQFKEISLKYLFKKFMILTKNENINGKNSYNYKQLFFFVTRFHNKSQLDLILLFQSIIILAIFKKKRIFRFLLNMQHEIVKSFLNFKFYPIFYTKNNMSKFKKENKKKVKFYGIDFITTKNNKNFFISISYLSSGEAGIILCLLMIINSIYNKVKILLFDETDAYLDQQITIKFLLYLKKLSTIGAQLFLISYHKDLLKKCDKLYICSMINSSSQIRKFNKHTLFKHLCNNRNYLF
ncbi:hypothetical protein (nucleomorph) [Guillardia theta]|uniref:RecF/RecN/SMC N-terminal domain-containing protein n=1 Tax=Guillardia theta TaxID=55529 RepID=Q98RN9_GUITH|nr:hypothetical protein GTHECHR1115 [Guillardia theta]AAK39908.1 hypothetical protein [Guillardia theta]